MKILGLVLSFVLLLVLPANAAQLILTWTDNAFDEQGFRIERCQVISPAVTCSNFIQIASVSSLVDTGNIKTYVSANLAINTTWCYRVRAYNQAGSSAYSNEACGTASAQTAPLNPDNLGVQ